MTKGGYQIIDLNDVNHINDVGVIHNGIYNKIKSTRKVILLSGIVFRGIKYNDMFVFPKYNYNTGISMKIGNIDITINENDVVKFIERVDEPT